MKHFLTIILFSIFLFLQSFGQTARPQFTSINEVGLLNGSKGDAWTMQTINGFQKGKTFAGLGIGLDFYNERTFPLFINVRRDMTAKTNTPFAYANAGINFLWLNDFEKAQRQNSTSSPGIFYDLGIGWKLQVKNKTGFVFSAGYSLKQVKQKIKYNFWTGTVDQDLDNYERYNSLYRRIVVKIGFSL